MKAALTLIWSFLFTTCLLSSIWPLLFIASAVAHLGWDWAVTK
jgi:hypothetical protein